MVRVPPITIRTCHGCSKPTLLWLVLSLLFIGAGVARAVEPVLVLGDADEYRLDDYVMLLEDPDNRLTIDDVRASPWNNRFRSPTPAELNPGFTPSTYWITLRIAYPEDLPPTQRFLELKRSQINEASLYLPDGNGGFQVQSSDLTTNFSDRAVRHFNSVFLVEPFPGDTVTLYLRVRTDATLQILLTLSDLQAFSHRTAMELFAYGLFYGSMAVLLLYNLVIYFSVKDTSYLIYIVYVGTAAIFLFMYQGHSVMIVNDKTSLFDIEYLPIYVWVSYSAALIFIQRFVQTKIYHPKLNYLLHIFYMTTIANAIVGLFVAYTTALLAVAILVVVTQPLLFVLSYHTLREGNENSRPLFATVVSNFIGTLTLSSIALGMLPSTNFTNALSPLGTIVGALVLSFALGNRIKRTKQEVIQANEQTVKNLSAYSSIYNNSIEGMYQIHLSSGAVDMNNACYQMLGFGGAVGDIKAIHLSKRLGYLQNNAAFIQDVRRLGSVEYELRYQEEGKRDKWLIHSAQWINDGLHSPHLRGTINDITERRERNIVRDDALRERLEKEFAQRDSTSRNHFLSLMNHNIRTPLTSIIGFSEVAKTEEVDGGTKADCYQEVVKSSRLLLSLINDILDFSKIEAEKLTLERIPVCIKDVIADLRNQFQSERHEAALIYSVGASVPPSIMLDPLRFQQVLENVIKNALRKSERGSIAVALSWQPDPQALVIDVSDEGEGYNDTQLDHLFNVFTLDVTHSTRFSDDGRLELPLVYMLVSLMGGKVSVTSEVGKGSCFTLRIPCKPDKGDTRKANSAKTPTGTPILEKGLPACSGRVLLAEDNKTNQLLIGRLIEKTGAALTVVENGQQAVERVNAETFDLVLMDINMPVMSGLDATRIIRSSPGAPPVYALSAEDSQQALTACIEAGCVGHLSKPIVVADLHAVIYANAQ